MSDHHPYVPGDDLWGSCSHLVSKNGTRCERPEDDPCHQPRCVVVPQIPGAAIAVDQASRRPRNRANLLAHMSARGTDGVTAREAAQQLGMRPPHVLFRELRDRGVATLLRTMGGCRLAECDDLDALECPSHGAIVTRDGEPVWVAITHVPRLRT